MSWHFLDHAIVGVALWMAARSRGRRRAGWLTLCAAAFARTADYHHRGR